MIKLKILLVIIENIFLVYGVVYLNWNITSILFIFGFECFLISIFTFFKLSINGGNELFYKYLPIDKSHYTKIKISDKKNSSPFFSYSVMLMLWNFFLLCFLSFALFTDFRSDSLYLIFLILFNQLFFFLTVKIKNENELISFISTPVRTIFFVGLGTMAGSVLAKIFGINFFLLVGFLSFKLMLDIISFTADFKSFNRDILEFFGIQLLKQSALYTKNIKSQ